jgi:hypothetical protein
MRTIESDKTDLLIMVRKCVPDLSTSCSILLCGLDILRLRQRAIPVTVPQYKSTTRSAGRKVLGFYFDYRVGQTNTQAEARTGILFFFFFFSAFVLCIALLLFLLLPATLELAPAFLPGFDSSSDSESAVGSELKSRVVTTSLCMTHVRRRLEKIGRVAKNCAVGKEPERKSARPSMKDVIVCERWRTA